jgi:hypothetical protein
MNTNIHPASDQFRHMWLAQRLALIIRQATKQVCLDMTDDGRFRLAVMFQEPLWEES